MLLEDGFLEREGRTLRSIICLLPCFVIQPREMEANWAFLGSIIFFVVMITSLRRCWYGRRTQGLTFGKIPDELAMVIWRQNAKSLSNFRSHCGSACQINTLLNFSEVLEVRCFFLFPFPNIHPTPNTLTKFRAKRH